MIGGGFFVFVIDSWCVVFLIILLDDFIFWDVDVIVDLKLDVL